jgi:hypothetical protein
MARVKTSLSVASMSIVLASTIVIFTGFGIFGIAHGQSNTTTASSLTPQERAAMCDSDNPKLNFVNTTESKLCGLPKTITSNMSNTTTGPAAPSVVPTPPESGS